MKKALAALTALLLLAVPAFADVTVEESHWYLDSGTEHAVFTAYDEEGTILWQLETESDQLGELDAISWFETDASGQKLLVNSTNYGLSCYDAATGDILWHVPAGEYSFGGGCSFAMDEDGNAYVGGYYGPDPVCISPDGEILWFADHGLDQDIYWLYELVVLDEGVLAVYDAWFDGSDLSDFGGYVIYGADGQAVASGTAEFSPYLTSLDVISLLETGTAGSSLKLASACAMILDRLEASSFWDEEFFIRIADSWISTLPAADEAAFRENFTASDAFIRLLLAGDEGALTEVSDSGWAMGYASYSPEKYDLFYTAVTSALEE